MFAEGHPSEGIAPLEIAIENRSQVSSVDANCTYLPPLHHALVTLSFSNNQSALSIL